MTLPHYGLALLVMLIWGLNVVVVKLGVAELPPLLLMTLRFMLVALVVTPFLPLARRHLPGVLALSVTLGAVHFGMIFVGIAGTDAATAAIIIQLGTPFSVILAWLIFLDVPGWRRGLGLVLAFGGVALLAGEPGRAEPLAVALLIFGALAWAVSNIVMKRIDGAHPVAVMGWLALFAVPQLMLASLLFESGQGAALVSAGWQGWGAVVFTALAATIIGHGLWYHLLHLYPMSQVVPLSLLGPLIGAFGGIFLLGEPLTWQKAAGGLMTLCGVAIIVIRESRRAEPARLAALPDVKPRTGGSP